jgi:hypothetical protein
VRLECIDDKFARRRRATRRNENDLLEQVQRAGPLLKQVDRVEMALGAIEPGLRLDSTCRDETTD